MGAVEKRYLSPGLTYDTKNLMTGGSGDNISVRKDILIYSYF